jgi:polyferredoxin
VIGRAAAGLCAVADLSFLGVIIADAQTSSTAVVLEAMAPPSGRLGLLAFGVHASIILGAVVAVNSLPGPGYGKNIFRRSDLSGLRKAAPALSLLAVSFFIYWCGFMGVTLFAWRGDQSEPVIAEVSADAAVLGAAAFALWLIFVALGMKSARSAGSEAALNPARRDNNANHRGHQP